MESLGYQTRKERLQYERQETKLIDATQKGKKNQKQFFFSKTL